MIIETIAGLGEALFQEARDALFVLDPGNDRLLDVNPAAEQLTGLPARELLAQPARHWFRFAGAKAADRLRPAGTHEGTFHSPDGFLLRTRDESVWLPVELTLSRLHVRPKAQALLTARPRPPSLVQLQRTEDLLRRVLASVPDGLWSAEITPAGGWQFRYLSPACADVLGRPPQELAQGPDRWRELVLPEDRPLWERAHARFHAAQSGHEEFQYRVVRPDQSVRWVRDRATLTRVGDIIHIDGVLSDISERVRAEEALSRERFLLLTLMDHLPDAVAFKDRDGRFLRVNAALARGLGLSDPARAVGKTDFDFFPREQAELYRREEQEVMRAGVPRVSREEKVLWPDGRETWVSSTVLPLRDAGGNVVGTLGVLAAVNDLLVVEEVEARKRNVSRPSRLHERSDPVAGVR